MIVLFVLCCSCLGKLRIPPLAPAIVTRVMEASIDPKTGLVDPELLFAATAKEGGDIASEAARNDARKRLQKHGYDPEYAMMILLTFVLVEAEGRDSLASIPRSDILRLRRSALEKDHAKMMATHPERMRMLLKGQDRYKDFLYMFYASFFTCDIDEDEHRSFLEYFCDLGTASAGEIETAVGLKMGFLAYGFLLIGLISVGLFAWKIRQMRARNWLAAEAKEANQAKKKAKRLGLKKRTGH